MPKADTITVRAASKLLVTHCHSTYRYHQTAYSSLSLIDAGPFIAMENFHYTAQFLGLSVQPTLEEIAAAGQHHCALAWPALQQRHGTNVSAEHLLHFCFR